MEKWQEDELWLMDRWPLATDSAAEDFCERVAIRVAEGMDEAKARALTLTEMRKKHAGVGR